jgi:hypothetical protein
MGPCSLRVAARLFTRGDSDWQIENGAFISSGSKA